MYDYKGVPMLFAMRGNITLALACSTPWIKRSAGFVGFSDGWQDLDQHGVMEWAYDRAENGNVALTGEVDLVKSQGSFTLALGFGLSISSLAVGTHSITAVYSGDGYNAGSTSRLKYASTFSLRGTFSVSRRLLSGCGSPLFLPLATQTTLPFSSTRGRSTVMVR